MSKPVCAVVGIGPMNGASLSRRFAAEGHAVAMLSRSTELSGELASELDDARAYACDVTDADSVAAAFAAVRGDLGDPEVLVYNAGAGVWGDIDKLEAADFEKAWRVNAMGLFLCAKQVIGPMKERGSGSIAVIGATASLRGKPFTTAFAPAKAAQRSLAQAMARKLWPSGIHVSLVIVDGQIKLAGPDTDRRAPTHLDPDDIADAVHYLTRQPRSAWSFEIDLRPTQESW